MRKDASAIACALKVKFCHIHRGVQQFVSILFSCCKSVCFCGNPARSTLVYRYYMLYYQKTQARQRPSYTCFCAGMEGTRLPILSVCNHTRWGNKSEDSTVPNREMKQVVYEQTGVSGKALKWNEHTVKALKALITLNGPDHPHWSPLPTALGPGALFKLSQGSLLLHLKPYIWNDFSAWPWICLIKLILPNPVDSWLDWPWSLVLLGSFTQVLLHWALDSKVLAVQFLCPFHLPGLWIMFSLKAPLLLLFPSTIDYWLISYA